MPLGVVTDNDFELELKSLGLVSISIETETIEIKHGRGHVLERTDDERALLVGEVLSGSSIREVAEEHNASPSSISAYMNGANSTSTYDDKNDELIKRNNDTINNITGRAQDKLMRALDHIDIQPGIKPTIASTIAKDMSTVMKNLRREDGVTVNNNKVIVYRPRLKEEEDYDVLDVDT